jgi:phosphatidylserine/phosphatidylglycerophosphate/cardiolipin synthase-like enzyme
MAFAFTRDDMGDAMIARARAGVSVRGVFERNDSENEFGEYNRLKAAKLDVWQDGNPYLMHHKVIIIDDRTVVVGSYNFSASANRSNDENILIIDSVELARQYTAEFERVYAQAKDKTP